MTSGSATSKETSVNPKVEKMANMSQDELDKIYAEAEAGPIPDGIGKGTSIVFPDSPAYEKQQEQKANGQIWEGKVFTCPDPKGPGMLKNKVNGTLLFPAEVYYGTSAFDGKDCIVLDYKNAPEFPFMKVMDEIRKVDGGIYLGRMYRIEENGNLLFLLNFILDFN